MRRCAPSAVVLTAEAAKSVSQKLGTFLGGPGRVLTNRHRIKKELERQLGPGVALWSAGEVVPA